MRKWMIVLAVLTITLTISSKNANAQTTVLFGPSTTGSITFTATGTDNVNITLGTLSDSNFSLVTTGGAITARGPLGSGGGISYFVDMNSATSTFTYNGSGGTLIGTVIWNNMISDGKATLSGILTVTSNTTSLSFSVGSTAYIDFTTTGVTGATTDLSSLFSASAGKTDSAKLFGGEFTLTPEPSSILLFGTGLLALGGILRRRLGLV